jgi:O-antigen/teichoic acid export membrane protein
LQSSNSQEAPPLRRGAKTYLAASAIAQGCALARYTFLARLLGPEQLGLAATLILAAQFFDSITDSGADRFLIQDQHGDEGSAQRLVQLVFVGRGLFSAACLVILAAPLAAFYRTPALTMGFVVLALSPLIAGFVHLDMRRVQRHHDFRAEGVATLAGESFSLIGTVAAAWLTHSFTAVIYGLIARSTVIVLVSHLLAKRPYGLGFARSFAPRLARYGIPLMLNGLLLFASSQGDRVLVAKRLGLTELGHYSAAILLIYYPAGILQRYVAAMHLPRIAAGRDDPAVRGRAADLLGGQTLLLAVAMAIGFAIVAPTMVVVLDSAKFATPALVMALIGILQTSRFLRLWPNTVAMGIGRSGVVLANNIARLVAIPAALLAVALGGGLAGVASGFILGELVALATALVMLNRDTGLPLLAQFDRFAIFALTSGAIVGWITLARRPSILGVVGGLVATTFVVAWIVKRERVTINDAADLARRLVRRTSPGIEGCQS